MEYTLNDISEAFDLLDDEKGVEAEVGFKLRANDNVYDVLVWFNYTYMTYGVCIEYGTNELLAEDLTEEEALNHIKHFVEQEF